MGKRSKNRSPLQVIVWLNGKGPDFPMGGHGFESFSRHDASRVLPSCGVSQEKVGSSLGKNQSGEINEGGKGGDSRLPGKSGPVSNSPTFRVEEVALFEGLEFGDGKHSPSSSLRILTFVVASAADSTILPVARSLPNTFATRSYAGNGARSKASVITSTTDHDNILKNGNQCIFFFFLSPIAPIRHDLLSVFDILSIAKVHVYHLPILTPSTFIAILPFLVRYLGLSESRTGVTRSLNGAPSRQPLWFAHEEQTHRSLGNPPTTGVKPGCIPQDQTPDLHEGSLVCYPPDPENFKNTQEQYQEHSRTQLHLERVSLTYTMLYLEREFGCQEELKWDALNLCPRPPIYTTKGCIETKHEIMKLHCARVAQNPARARNETA
ncbi:hypothetical protein LXL04_000420 [Taraxacum kok-saghyz]